MKGKRVIIGYLHKGWETLKFRRKYMIASKPEFGKEGIPSLELEILKNISDKYGWMYPVKVKITIEEVSR